MNAKRSTNWHRVTGELKRHGLLLRSDAKLPSVVSIVVGGPVRGSWWKHPQAHAIYEVCKRLAADRDVLIVKLVSNKVTYVHRRLWPALVAAATADEPWQRRGLSAAAGSMFRRVVREGELRTDRLPSSTMSRQTKPGDAARELESRLLVFSEEIHTESGAHSKRLETWKRWCRRAGCSGRKLSSTLGKRLLEEAVDELNCTFGGRSHLPWQS